MWPLMCKKWSLNDSFTTQIDWLGECYSYTSWICLMFLGKDSSEDTVVEEDASSSGCCSRPHQPETTTEILD